MICLMFIVLVIIIIDVIVFFAIAQPFRSGETASCEATCSETTVQIIIESKSIRE